MAPSESDGNKPLLENRGIQILLLLLTMFVMMLFASFFKIGNVELIAFCALFFAWVSFRLLGKDKILFSAILVFLLVAISALFYLHHQTGACFALDGCP